MRRPSPVVTLVGTVAGTGLGLVVLLVLLAAVVFRGCELDLGTGDLGDPGRGDRSEQLDVSVAPTEGLTDGATAFVSSRAFRPHGIVGVAVCLEEALTEREGAAACDVDGGQRFAVDASGELAAVIAVPRVITVDGEAHDCATRPGRCLVVAADSAELDLSGGQPIAFAPDLPPVELVPAGERARSVLLPGTVAPDGAVASGTTVTVTATGFVPDEPVLVGQCTPAFLQADPWQVCQVLDDDLGDAFTAVATRTVDGLGTRADGEGRVEVEVTVLGAVRPAFGGDGGDCTAVADACALVVAAAADTQRSAYLPLTITG